MRNFAIGLLLLNLLYLVWNLELIPGSATEQQVVVRSAGEQAPQSLVLLSELEELPSPRRTPLAPIQSSSDVDNANDAETADAGQVQADAVLATQNTNETVPLACLAVGSFQNVAESNELALTLRQQGFETEVELSEETQSEYRVYMPPFNSDAAARQTLANLLESGIDSFIITDGDLARGISLGVFTREASAYRLQEELAAQGYATGIQEIIRSNTEFWVLIRAASATELQALWSTLAQARNSLIQSENLCEIVAPEG